MFNSIMEETHLCHGIYRVTYRLDCGSTAYHLFSLDYYYHDSSIIAIDWNIGKSFYQIWFITELEFLLYSQTFQNKIALPP